MVGKAAVLLLSAAAIAAAADHRSARIQWDSSTLTLIQRNGLYGRMARLPDQNLLAIYERAARVYTRLSRDEGRTWEGERSVASFEFGTAANPEIAVLSSGWLLAAYNERPNDGAHRFAIKVLTSINNGESWSEPRLIYQAGADNGTGCWEPIFLVLPWGEVQIYFANEYPYPDTNEQEITMLRSFDQGETWSEPVRVSRRDGRRDGMPVPVLLDWPHGIAVAIEDNGLSGTFKPVIVKTAAEDNWQSGHVGGDSERRWSALEIPLVAGVYGGAPYLRQFPGGETVLSIQSGEGRARANTLDFSRMAVYVGDREARNFTNRSFPFDVAENASGLWNSLFIKNATTVTAISGTTVNGIRGLWAIDGLLAYEEKEP
ncbi:MAG: exo-alpha-sialidase [Bryobacterales bacterium]|nr:exo-alpha-sialidase [Bryobacterales bacterium]